jgi:AcrR family transcriptional regulator
MGTSEGDDVDIPRFLSALWGRDEPSRRGPKPGLTVAAIGAAGVRVADAEGLGAVSMSRVAGELGFTTMSLYRYLDSKTDLYDVMVDMATTPPPVAPAAADWRQRMDLWAHAMAAGLLAHPWILQIPILDVPLTPRLTLWMEYGLQAFADTRLTHQQRLSSMLLVDGFVRQFLRLAASITAGAADVSPAEAGRRYTRRLLALVDRETYPALVAATEAGALEDDSDFATEEFEFGLARVLDGIDRLVDGSEGAQSTR